MVKVLSLCDGLSCALLAFKNLGIEVEYHAVEIDKYARQLSDDNFPEIVRWSNDVTEITEQHIIDNGPYDWIMFGSPCQSFSVAGKGEGLDGKSGLLIDCFKVLKWCQKQNPNLKYLIENVKMKKEFLDQCNQIIGSEPVLVNSALLSAQRRERYYWTNFPISQPEDKGILLKDILEDTVDKSLYFKPKVPIEVSQIRAVWDSSGKGHRSVQDRASQINGKMPCIPSKRADRLVRICIGYSKSTRYIDENGKVHASPGEGKTSKIETRIREDGKANTLTTGDGCMNQSTMTLVTEKDRDENFLFRKLSTRECARLQTIPDWFKLNSVSKTQQYKAIGNGWTISVISHIIKDALDFEQEKYL